MGHIFQLGRTYAEAFDLKVLDEHGKQQVVTMGSYGIGPSRAIAAIAEATLDDLGLCWPRAVAPVDVHLVATGKDDHGVRRGPVAGRRPGGTGSRRPLTTTAAASRRA
jgi:prolyl-tRNA synthetase